MTAADLHTHPDHRAFLAAVRAVPDDDTPRLVMADWLEEHDDPCGVECPHCAYDGCVQWGQACKVCGGSHRLPNGFAERAEFVRVQCELATRCVARGDEDEATWRLMCRCCELARDHDWFPRELGTATRFKERPLGFGVLSLEYEAEECPNPSALVSRGFVEEVRCPADDWLRHGDAVYAAHPVREVRLMANNPLATLDENMLRERWPGVRFTLPPEPRMRTDREMFLSGDLVLRADDPRANDPGFFARSDDGGVTLGFGG